MVNNFNYFVKFGNGVYYNVHIVEEIRKGLVQLATRKTDDYTSILMQGSGTYCVEATLGSVITPKHKLLILSNGAYGDRMGNIAEYHGMNYDMLAFDETEQVSVEYVDDYLARRQSCSLHPLSAFYHASLPCGLFPLTGSGYRL